jgi:hypothetical protein
MKINVVNIRELVNPLAQRLACEPTMRLPRRLLRVASEENHRVHVIVHGAAPLQEGYEIQHRVAHPRTSQRRGAHATLNAAQPFPPVVWRVT